MNRYLLLLLAILLLPSVLRAQPDPNAGPGQPPPPPNKPFDMPPVRFGFTPRAAVAEATPNGLFLLSEGVLARYSPDLEQCATLQLLPPLPPPPIGEGKDQQALQKWFNERALRSTPAAMLADGDLLYIVYAGSLLRVNQNTLKVEKTALDPPRDANRQVPNASTAPLLKRYENTLYIIRQFDLVAVDVKAFTVLKRADLPQDMVPAMPMPGPIGPQPGGMGPQPGGEDAVRAVTLVGTIGTRKEKERTIFLLQDQAGLQYLLMGEQVDRLAAQGDLDGKRARVTGLPEGRGVPAGVNSALRVQAIQVLEE